MAPRYEMREWDDFVRLVDPVRGEWQPPCQDPRRVGGFLLSEREYGQWQGSLDRRGLRVFVVFTTSELGGGITAVVTKGEEEAEKLVEAHLNGRGKPKTEAVRVMEVDTRATGLASEHRLT